MAQASAAQGPYKMSTIGRLTGYAPELLRAWERRHGLLKPLRGSGGHRLYTDDDLQVLLAARDLIADGRSIGEVARIGREQLLEQVPEARQSTPAPEPAPIDVGRDLDGDPDSMARWIDVVVAGAMEMDAGKINRALDEAFATTSPETAIFQLILPAAREIGEMWSQGKCSVASEHLATGLFVHRLRKMLEAAEPVTSDWSPVIVACFPDEYHQLGALITSYWLCRNGLRVNYLGAAMPFDDLRLAWEVTVPPAVILSVTRPAIYELCRAEFRKTLAAAPKGMSIYVGGQGTPTKDARVEREGAHIFAPGSPITEVIPEIVNAIREQPRIRSGAFRWA